MRTLVGFAVGVAAAWWWFERYLTEDEDEAPMREYHFGGSNTSNDCEARFHPEAVD